MCTPSWQPCLLYAMGTGRLSAALRVVALCHVGIERLSQGSRSPAEERAHRIRAAGDRVFAASYASSVSPAPSVALNRPHADVGTRRRKTRRAMTTPRMECGKPGCCKQSLVRGLGALLRKTEVATAWVVRPCCGDGFACAGPSLQCHPQWPANQSSSGLRVRADSEAFADSNSCSIVCQATPCPESWNRPPVAR